MKFTTLDLELNQPSNKIIQIGAAVFDTDHGLVDEFCAYVDPGEPINWEFKLDIGKTLEELLADGFRSKHAEYCRPTTGMVKQFWEWHRDTQAGKKFIQWGSGDMALLKQASSKYPSRIQVLDLKQVYQYFWQPAMRLPKRSGLSTACNSMGIDPPKYSHDAYWDAEATGRLALKLYNQVNGLGLLLRKALHA